MLTIPLEKLTFIVEKAREFDALVPAAAEDSGSNPADALGIVASTRSAMFIREGVLKCC